MKQNRLSSTFGVTFTPILHDIAKQCVYQYVAQILPVAVIYYLGAGLCGVVGMLFIVHVQLSGHCNAVGI